MDPQTKKNSDVPTHEEPGVKTVPTRAPETHKVLPEPESSPSEVQPHNISGLVTTSIFVATTSLLLVRLWTDQRGAWDSSDLPVLWHVFPVGLAGWVLLKALEPGPAEYWTPAKYRCDRFVLFLSIAMNLVGLFCWSLSP